MALTQGSLLIPSDIIALKAKVKAEMNRRHYGSSPLTAYGSESWDYTVTPQSGQLILSEHAQKIIEPLNQITSQGYSPASGAEAKAMNVINARVDLYAAEDYLGSSSCSANCAGLCVGCSGTCQGSCTGTCKGSCSGCTGTCTGSCSSCSGSCTGSCSGCSGCGGCGGCGSCSGCSGCGSGCSGCSGGCTGK